MGFLVRKCALSLGVNLYFSPFFTCVPMLCPSKMCFPWDFQGVPHLGPIHWVNYSVNSWCHGGKKHSSYITLYNNILGKHCYNIVLSIYYIHYILGKQDIMIYNVSMFPLGKQDITLFIGMEQNTLIQKWSANVGHLFCTNTALW
jgi:hypothetical protein